MERFKKLTKTLLFPRIAVMLLLLPISAVFLVYSLLRFNTENPIAIISYVLATYTLTVWCIRIPKGIIFLQKVKKKNKYAVRWEEDVRFRVNISLLISLIWNTAYAIFQLFLGIKHSSFWYCSMAGYYICLALMRYFMLEHTKKHRPGEKRRAELEKYRTCGWGFLLLNVAVTVMIFFMVYWNRTFNHDQITTIAMAAYTFTTFTTAIVNTVKYRQYNSPVYSASKAISLASACVSMITLTSTMLTTFGDSTLDLAFRKWTLGLLGGSVSAFIIGMAIYMILQSTKALKAL